MTEVMYKLGGPKSLHGGLSTILTHYTPMNTTAFVVRDDTEVICYDEKREVLEVTVEQTEDLLKFHELHTRLTKALPNAYPGFVDAVCANVAHSYIYGESVFEYPSKQDLKSTLVDNEVVVYDHYLTQSNSDELISTNFTVVKRSEMSCGFDDDSPEHPITHDVVIVGNKIVCNYAIRTAHGIAQDMDGTLLTQDEPIERPIFLSCGLASITPHEKFDVVNVKDNNGESFIYDPLGRVDNEHAYTVG